MAPRSNKVDITYPQQVLDRADRLAELTGEARTQVLRRACVLGLAVIEEEIAKHIAFENSLAVQDKLKRRGKSWEQAIELLKAGALSAEDSAKVLELLQRSAGG